MHTGSDGKKKMSLKKGAAATSKPDDAVDTPAATTPAATTDAAATKPATRRLQDANATKATTTVKDDSWKKLKGEDEFMEVIIGDAAFAKGGPLHGIKKPIITFNKHSADYVKEFPRGRAKDYDMKTGKRKNATVPAAAAAAVNASQAVADEDDALLEDTIAQQVLELEFIIGEDMEDIPMKNLTKGMLKICMMMKSKNQTLQYMNEENDMMQADGIEMYSMVQTSTKDEENQRERKGWRKCVDLTHATTFATIDGEASSSLFSFSSMVLMSLLAVLFFKN